MSTAATGRRCRPSATRLRLGSPSPTRAASSEPTLQPPPRRRPRFEDGTRALVARVEDFPLDILFVRTDDIAEFVADGVADLGITGTNLLVESGAELAVLLELGYGHCRLEAAVPQRPRRDSLEDLAGLRLATSHPQTAPARPSRASASPSRS